MKRLTVDLDYVKLPPKQLANKFSKQSKTRAKMILKRAKIKVSPKKPMNPKIIQMEHNYVNLENPTNVTPAEPMNPNMLSYHPSNQLSLVPTQAKVNIQQPTRTTSNPIDKLIGSGFPGGGRVTGCMIETNSCLFNQAVKDIVLKVQSALDSDGECILRKIVNHLGEDWVMSKFIPIKARSDSEAYDNFMQLSTEMKLIFNLMKKKLEGLKLHRTLNSLTKLERIFYSAIVGCLAVDKALGRVLYPLYLASNVYSKTVISSNLRKKINKKKELVTSSSIPPPIVILSDDDKNEAKKAPAGPNLLSTTIINNNFQTQFPQFVSTPMTPAPATGIEISSTTPTTTSCDPIQIRSEESEEGYTLTTTLKKQKSNKPRGEFENYMRFLVEKYLDKDTAITAQKKENLEMVIKQASVMYPEQYHEVRKRIRSILRNTRRNKSRLMMRNLQDFGNSTAFNSTSMSSPPTPQLATHTTDSLQIIMQQPNQSQSHMLSPFASFTQQKSPIQPVEPSPITPSNPPFFGTEVSKRTQGMRFKIPHHLEVLQPPPLVSVEGDLAKQFALYNYIACQKDSEGFHLCSHFLEHTFNKDENVKFRQPIDMRTIALKIKICWYAALKDLVKDLELMLDNNIKLHQLRSFIGRDALKLKQLMTNKLKELMKDGDDVVDLTTVSSKPKEENSQQNTNKLNTKQQLNNFFQALENYRDSNSRVLLFTFLFPPSGLKTPVKEKNFPTLTDVKLKLKNNSYATLTDLAHSVLYIIHTYLSVYVPNSQAFRDSEEMAKYVLLLYKEQTGENMLITETAPKVYSLPGRKGQFALALPTADFLGISYHRLYQCFSIIPAGELDIQALYAQGVDQKNLLITHFVPYKEVENLINQKLKCTHSESRQVPVAAASNPGPKSPIQSTPVLNTAVQNVSPQSIVAKSTPTKSNPSLAKLFSSFKLKATTQPNKLNCYHFPSLMFKQHVIKRELCQYLGWSEQTFEVLFHSLRQIRAGQAEKDHLLKVYKVKENHRYPFFLIQYQDIKELESIGETSKGNGLIADIFRRREFPQGVLKGSYARWNKFLQFVDNRNNTYFIIRELMNKMNVTLQDMMLVMKFRVFQLDDIHGLYWIKEWEAIVNIIQKNPRYLESMVCLYNEQLEIGLNEMELVSKSGQVRGKMIINKFFQKMHSPTNPSGESKKTDPITISSEDEAVKEDSIPDQVVPSTTEEQFVSISDLAGSLGWSETQVETIFGKDQGVQQIHGSKLLAFSHVNQVLAKINEYSKQQLKIPGLSEIAVKAAPRLWNLPDAKEKHIILEDLGEYANIPMDVLETTYQVYIYDVKSDKDRTILSQQGLNLDEYLLRPIRMIDHKKVKWILDMKAKQETINFKSRTKEKRKVSKVSPKKTELQLKELSINLTKTHVDPVMMFKYNALQVLTIDCKLLTIEVRSKKIKLKIMDSEKLRKPSTPIKVYTVGGKKIVISHHLAEYTHIPQSNLFLFLLSYGITYFSNTAPTVKQRKDFVSYYEELKSQGLPKYKNVTLYPLQELEQLLLLRRIGFTNVKLIETYNLIQTTNQNQLTIALSSNVYHSKVIKQANTCKDTYSVEFKIHTIRDADSGKTIILKIFDDHYLFKPREQITVYNVYGGEDEKASLILLHDLARFTNIPLTRLQAILSSYSIPSLSNASTENESWATFKRYFNQLHTFGVPHYMKHTTLYHLEYLNSLLHLREVGFFNEKLLDVYKMIKLSPAQQKRILLTIKPTAPHDQGTKRPSDDSIDSPESKIPKTTPPNLNKSTDNKKTSKKPTARMQVSSWKPSFLRTLTHYQLPSRTGEWVFVSELAAFLIWNYATLHNKLKPHLLQLSSVDDYVEVLEQGGKLSVSKMLFVPLYVVSGIIDMKKREKIAPIRQALETIQNTPLKFLPLDPDQENVSDEDTNNSKMTAKSSVLMGMFSEDLPPDEHSEGEDDGFNLDSLDASNEFSIRTLWRNNKFIKLKIPSSHVQILPTSLPRTITVPNLTFNFFSMDEIAKYVQMNSQELRIGLGKDGISCPDGLPNAAKVTFLLRATEDLQLFIALRRMGIPKHKVWLIYFACKKITDPNEKIDLKNIPLMLKSDLQSQFSKEKVKIGQYNAELLLTDSIRQKEVLPRHICAMHKIPGSDEMYYIAEEVAVEMGVSITKLLNTRKLMVFTKIKRHISGNKIDKLSFTMIKVDDLRYLSLLYNLGIPGPVSLEIFQHLKQLPSSNPDHIHDFTSLCDQGYNSDSRKKWILLNKKEAVNLHQVASILRVPPELLETRYQHGCSRVQRNSVEHVFLLSQGLQFPPESNHCTFTNTNLLRDSTYLATLKPEQIRKLFAYRPDQWPRKFYPDLVNREGTTENELCIRTVRIEEIRVRLLSKENLKFTNVVKLYLIQKPTLHYVALASDLKRAFSPISQMNVNKLCECLKLEYKSATSLDIRCIRLQMDGLNADDVASMVLVRLNAHLRLILLLLGLGANEFEVWRVVKDSNWTNFHPNMVVLFTKTEEFDDWLFEYLTDRLDNDPHFYDLSQEYPFYLAEITPPQWATNIRKALKSSDLLPFWLWRLNSSGLNWISVDSLKNLMSPDQNDSLTSLLTKQKMVSENSVEGRVLLSQGFCFTSEDTQGFIRYDDFLSKIKTNICMERMYQLTNSRLEDLQEEDISMHTFLTPPGRVKVFTHLKYRRKILLKKYAICAALLPPKYMASLDDLLSKIPDEVVRSEVQCYISDTMKIRTLRRSADHPIRLIKWSQASLLGRLIEIGCGINIDLMLELHNLLTKQTEGVYRVQFTQSSLSLWFFLEGENTEDNLSCDYHVQTPDSDVLSQLADITLNSETNESKVCPYQEEPSIALTNEETDTDKFAETTGLEINFIGIVDSGATDMV